MRFKGKVVIVTGAASGIGLATARRFGAEGASVALVDLKAEKAEAAAEEVKRAGAPDALGIGCDVSDESQVTAVAAKARERWGAFHVVVNNAGLMIFKPLEQQTGGDWE